MATAAKDVMTGGVEVAREDDTILDVARKLADNELGALPVCGADDRLKGVVTDRDIVVNVLAAGKDPGSTRAGEISAGDAQTVTIGADDSLEEASRTMAEHGVRRLPVIDGDRVVGMLTQADLAAEDRGLAGETVDAISGQPANG